MLLADLLKYNLCYLGTPYSKYPDGIEPAFMEAAALAGRLLQAGVKVYSPIAHTHPIAIYGKIDPYAHEVWLPFDETMMRLSNAMIVGKMETWNKSYGVMHEIAYFSSAKKPVFFLDPNTLAVSDHES